ncbi:hypothetical protein ASD15_15260 [Massilia sp. Root351]|uniref:glycosyltransferase family 2 protein n=1 Tax=Massilia sp. Root351 TaxID=1736522 RepID=UPI000709578E|nr:glycosyltransferase [Massilia sp. Root351]KQV80225.1 hypothetical protein ASD15_15260 [Massilia sp. Root351]
MNNAPPTGRKPGASNGAPARRTAQRWHGAFEGLHRGLAYGWAVDSELPQQCVVLEILRDGEPLGSVIADVARSDLLGRFAAHGAHGACHGFVADLGHLAADAQGVLTARVANTGCVLPGHAELASTDAARPPLAIRSAVFSDGALRLHGWAADSRDERRKVTVRAYLGQQLLAETVADQQHPATRSAGVGDCGFTLDLPPALGDGRSHSVRVTGGNGEALNGSPLTVCCYADGARALLAADGGAPRGGVLASLLDGYERNLPRSLGLGHYPQWRTMFEAAAATAAAPAAQVGLIVAPGDAAALQRTLASIARQCRAGVRAFPSAAGKQQATQPFAAQVQAALGAGCQLLACVRAGDELPPHAVGCMLEAFAAPDVQLAYSDSERAGQPWFKPAWNPDYALASDYPLDLLLARADAVRALPEAALESAASLAWSLLAAHWRTAARAIAHVPRVLLHCGAPPDVQELQQRLDAAAAALRSVEPKSTLQALPGAPAGAGFLPRRVLRPLGKRERQAKVSLIIPTRDRVELLERCIGSIRRHTDWPGLELVVIDNDSALPRSRSYFRKLAQQGVIILPCPGPFNFATLNNAAVHAASGEIIGLVNNDIEALHGGWLDEMVGQLLRPGVGAVGAKLLWPNGMVQHGGVLLGVGNVAGHFGNRLADADWGDHGRNQLQQQVSAVTAACLLLRKRDYLAVGGMDGAAFPVAFNDVDLCLKLRQAGKAIVWTPHARLLHAESASRGHEDTPQKRARALREIDQLRARWGQALQHDPAYHPSLNLDPHSHAYGGLALPPRDRTPRLAGLRNDDNHGSAALPHQRTP